jgi:tripeptide aminopeptidase
MSTIQQIFDQIDQKKEEWLQEIITIASLPAPSFQERQRSEYVKDRLLQIGLEDISVDDLGNVLARLEGEGPGPTIMFVAHLDTVFSQPEHKPPKIEGNRLTGSSVKDNSAGVAGLIALAGLLKQNEAFKFKGTIQLVFSVCEEGIGDLKGIRAVMEKQPLPDLVIGVDCTLGMVVTQGVASSRWEVKINSRGGHAWGDFGQPNSIHIASQCICDIYSLPLPSEPKCIVNVGTITGGTAINAIANHATFSVDIRSGEQEGLNMLVDKFHELLKNRAKTEGVNLVWKQLGSRPGGKLALNHPIRSIIKDIHGQLGISNRECMSSTDANIPLSMGLPAVTIGVCHGKYVHSPAEYLEIDSIPLGIKQLILLVDKLLA